MTRPKKRTLKERVEMELGEMLSKSDEPSDGRMKLLKLSIGFLAVQAKLEENEYGDFFDADPAGVQKQSGKKPDARSHPSDQDYGESGEGSFFSEGENPRLPS